jgi:hypothetical protein
VGTSYPEEEECDPPAGKARVRKKIHKYEIEVPTSFVRAKELDRINGNTLLMDALKLEMQLQLPFRSLRTAKMHHRDGRSQVATLSGT